MVSICTKVLLVKFSLTLASDQNLVTKTVAEGKWYKYAKL